MTAISTFASRRQHFIAIAFIICACNAFPLSLHHNLFRYDKYLQTHHATAFTDDIDTQTPSSLQISNASARLDPLLTSFLLRSIRNSSNNEEDVEDSTPAQFTFSDASKAIVGLRTWETCLRKARLPLIDDFQQTTIWPEEPLFYHVYDALSALGLPRLVRRHPETLTTSVLLGLARIVIEFIKAQRQGKLVISEDNGIDKYDEYGGEDDTMSDIEDGFTEFEYEQLSPEELNQLADSLASNLKKEWGGVVQGLAQLDKVFGYDHGLLDQQGEAGFGVNDGIWKHSGWIPMPDLQRRISSMPELRDLLSKLGRRPSSQGKDNRKFKPRKRSYAKDDMTGVELDPLDPTSVSGLTLSDSLTTMLPTEAVLLRSSMRALRLLFLAKKAESKLLSYELSGWTDVPTKPLPHARRSINLPSLSGGPLIICLDTSHSMSGMREDLSKAVVLASVTAAHKQGRDCRIVSFSSLSNTVESGNITCDADGLRKLLDFLSYSFGGGTDVTGALKHAMQVLENDMASSDLLLVSDGELPNPPVSKFVLAKLETLKQQTGMEIHGLLVGKRESESLNLLCTEVHYFLGNYDGIIEVRNAYAGSRTSSRSALSLTPPARRPSLSPPFHRMPLRRCLGVSLGAMNQPDYETERLTDFQTKLNKRSDRTKSKKKQWVDDDDDDYWDFQSDGYIDPGRAQPSSSGRILTDEDQVEKSEFVLRVEDAINSLHDTATKLVEERKQSSSDMNTTQPSSNKIISDTIAYVESGLVERDLEARLVVLGMVSQEHILFIGPPGTSKSEIGRRLSQLCGGPFFQRLFTRFTTPEEIFGPLSLRALENDEYKRCIDGFLPMATVAFLDEIFKANSAILNTLLTILNERKFDNGAGSRVDCPLKCVIGASNELPDSDELDALLDRFILRSYVTSVTDEGLMKILSAQSATSDLDGVDPNISNSLDEVVKEISTSLDSVSIGPNICVLIRDLRTFLRDDLGIYVSDRRLIKATRLLKVAAVSEGRTRVDFVDCLLLQHIMWQLPEHRDTIREWLWDNMTPGNDIVEQTTFVFQGLASESLALAKKTMGDITGEAGARAADLDAINSIRNELEDIEQLLQQNKIELDRHIALLDIDHLWISRDEAEAAKQHLLPLAEELSDAVNQALLDTIWLKLALSSDSIDNDIRSSVIEALINNQNSEETTFTDEELQMSLKEAKRQYKGDLLRKWKSERALLNTTE